MNDNIRFNAKTKEWWYLYRGKWYECSVCFTKGVLYHINRNDDEDGDWDLLHPGMSVKTQEKATKLIYLQMKEYYEKEEVKND